MMQEKKEEEKKALNAPNPVDDWEKENDGIGRKIENGHPDHGIEDLEDVINMIKPFGIWQIISVILLFWMQITTAMVNMVIAFMKYTPNPFYCSADATEFMERLEKNSSATGSCYLLNDNTTRCSEYAYDQSTMSRTVVTDWDLVCGREWEMATAQMVHMLGILVGSAVVGLISDKFGRKPCLFIFLLMQTVFLILQGLSPNYIMFLIMRFFAAVTIPSAWIPAFAYSFLLSTLFHKTEMLHNIELVGEIVNNRYRTLLTGLFFIPYAIGYAGLSPLAYICRDWRLMCYVIAAMNVPLFFFACWFIESPRWLIVKNRMEEAAHLLGTVIPARNRVKLPEDFDMLQTIQRIAKEERSAGDKSSVESESFVKIFSYPKLMIRAVIIISLWFANNIVYYGISLNLSTFSGDVFLNNAIFGLVEIPSYAIATLALKIGRKRSQVILLTIAGISLLPVPWVPDNLKLIFGVVGKLAISASFAAIYVFTNELYPTVVRNSGLGISSMASRIGGMVAPYIGILATIDKSLAPVPLIIYGVLSLVGAVMVLLLPETMNKPLADTFAQALRQ